MRFGARPQARLGLKALAVTALVVGGLFAAPAAAAPDSAIVVDARTGKVLYANNADSRRFPASLTKMMTLYLLFEAIDTGKTSLNARITISEHAASQAPSKLGLKPGQTIKVRDAIMALVTKSANDIASAIGEHVAGSETAFARLMTARAHDLGMSHTVFKNANGLPNSSQYSTARDLATLGQALRLHYPQYYSYFATRSFVWNGRRIANHNRLLGKVKGVDGIKTGYTRASGFNLVTSVQRGNRKIVAVVIGGETGSARDKLMAQLIDKYIGKATTSSKRVASIPGKVTQQAAATAAADMPLPTLRPTVADGETTMTVAAIVEANEPQATDDNAPVSIASLTAGANSVFALDQTTDTAEGDVATDDEAADDAAPATAPLTGWRIQIAAAPSKAQAEDILDRALAKGAQVLAAASPYTEPVETGGTTLYRARFAGFASKDAAWNACAYLEKQKFSCLAVSD